MKFGNYLLLFFILFGVVARASHLGEYVEGQIDGKKISGRVTRVINNHAGKILIIRADDDIEYEVPMENAAFPKTVLVVIDMQQLFLDRFVEPCYQKKLKDYLRVFEEQFFDDPSEYAKGQDVLNNVLDSVVSEVEKAVLRKQKIVLVEYANHGPTHQKIRDVLMGYDDVHVVIKKQNDGAKYIKKMFEENNFTIEKMKICGINTEACVLSTVLSLPRKFPALKNIAILADSCSSANGVFEHQFGVEAMDYAELTKIKTQIPNYFSHGFQSKKFFELKNFLQTYVNFYKNDLHKCKVGYQIILDLLADYPLTKLKDGIFELLQYGDSETVEKLLFALSEVRCASEDLHSELLRRLEKTQDDALRSKMVKAIFEIRQNISQAHRARSHLIAKPKNNVIIDG